MCPIPVRARLLLLVLCLFGASPSAAQVVPDFAAYEARLDSVLHALERPGEAAAALAAYRDVEHELLAHRLEPDDTAYAAQQRLLAYVLLRQGNMLRQLGRGEEALLLAERELAAARASGDPLTAARTEFSLGTTLLANRHAERGMEYLERARALFEASAEPEFRQGLGWYWIIRADLAAAGLAPATPAEAAGFADAALEMLLPLRNSAGIARAYSARARAREQLGDHEAAAADRAAEARYTALADRAAEP